MRSRESARERKLNDRDSLLWDKKNKLISAAEYKKMMEGQIKKIAKVTK